MHKKTDYYGSTQASRLWAGKKSVAVKLTKRQALKLAASLRKGVVGTGKNTVEMCIHLPNKHITTYSHEV